MIVEAIRTRGSFNLIHFETSYKLDVFIMRRSPFEQSTRKRVSEQVLPESEHFAVPVVSPEDIILKKLEWYRLGGEISERQWLDVLGVLRVQADNLDLNYLNQWAAQLDVTDLLTRAFVEARL